MINKKDLLKDVRKYSPEQIAEAIRSGEVSMYELGKETEGAFTPLLKRQVKEILERPIQTEQEESAKLFSSDAYRNVSEELSHSNREEEVPFEMKFTDEPSIETLSLDVEDTVIPTPNTNTVPVIDNKQNMFSRPFSFSGRIRRTEYGITVIIGFFINIFMSAMISSAGNTSSGDSEGILILYFIILIPYLWFLWAQGAKRCHDLGNSGFFQLIPFYVFWMLFAEGDPEPNEYGNSPK